MGILLYVGKKQHGLYCLKDVIGYVEKSFLKQYFILVPILLVYNPCHSKFLRGHRSVSCYVGRKKLTITTNLYVNMTQKVDFIAE